jgi:fengycin family lipopeptide synthetase D
MFINTLALRNYPANQKILTDLLGEIKERSLNAFEIQDYPFEDLVEKVQAGRDVSRNPIFDVMFVLHNYASPAGGVQELEIEGLKLKPYGVDSNTSLFDMSFSGVEFNETLLFSVEYCTKLFKKETIERFTGYFHKIISSCQEVLEKKLSDIDILSGEEKNRLLHQFNNTEIQYPKDKTIHELFREQVELTPDHVALTGQIPNPKFQIPNKREPLGQVLDVFGVGYLSYKELDEKSSRLAHLLREKVVQSDTIVGIMVERSLETIVGILGILKAGGAYLPIDPDYPAERIQYMLVDSGAEILVTTRDISNKIIFEKETIYLLDKINHIPPRPHLYLPPAPVTCLAYIIYTSGTTGRPKGVTVTHGNVINLVWGLKEKIYQDYIQRLRVCVIAAYVFDASVKQVFAVLLLGQNLYVVPGEDRIEGSRLLQYYQKHKIDISDGTPAHIGMLVESLISHPHDVPVRLFLIGGEALPKKVVTGFFNYFEQRGKNIPRLTNVYGPSECCVDSTCYEVTPANVRRLEGIPIGQPMPNYQVYIVDRWNQLQPVGVVGELCVVGVGVARGYLNQPELTEEKFIRNPYSKAGEDRMYRTGDLGRWMPDGSANIEFLGRIDRQVKIRGFRIELEEIENQLVKYNEIQEAVVTALDDEQTGKYLAAYLVPDTSLGIKEFDVSQIREYLQQQLPDYMIPSYFVRLEEIPLTPNGKVDRKRLPEPGTTGFEGSSYQAPRSPVEKKLVEIWSKVLGIEKNSIGIDDNFFERGGHSLRAIVMTETIHKEFDVMVPLAEVFKTPTIKALTRYITGAQPALFVPIPALESKDYYKLSINQKRLWIIQQFDPGNSAYNISAAARLNDKIDQGAIRRAMTMILKRHESLRTGFTYLDGEPVQFIMEEVVPSFKIIDISSMNREAKEKKKKHLFSQEAAAPFDLSRPPLLRALLVKLDGQHHELFLNMHHIVTDGWSMEILQREFLYLYEGYRKKEEVVLEPVRLQYKDFSGWQNERENDKELKEKAHRYWRKIVETGLPALNLPYDSNFQRKDDENMGIGAWYSFIVDEKTRDRLNRLAIDNHTTLFVVMFAAYNLLLSLLSGQKEILCNIISAGRDHFSLQDIVGFFVNAIVVKQAVDPEIGFNDFLDQVKHTVLEAFQYQNYPLELVLEELNLNYPPVSAAFNMLNVRQDTREIGSNDSEIHQIAPPRSVKFNMLMLVTEHKNGLSIRWNYKKACFKPETIEFISKGYQKLLKDIIDQEVVS